MVSGATAARVEMAAPVEAEARVVPEGMAAMEEMAARVAPAIPFFRMPPMEDMQEGAEMAASVAPEDPPASAARPDMVAMAVMAGSVALASCPPAPFRFSTPEPFGEARERVAVLVASVVRPEATAWPATAGREAAAAPPEGLAPGAMARTVLLEPAVPATASPVETAALEEMVALEDSGEQVVRDLVAPQTE